MLMMENLILRFPHIAQQIFEKLSDKSLTKCRQVGKLWQAFIDENSLPWIRIIKIPSILTKGNTYLHVASKSGQIKIFNMIVAEVRQ